MQDIPQLAQARGLLRTRLESAALKGHDHIGFHFAEVLMFRDLLDKFAALDGALGYDPLVKGSQIERGVVMDYLRGLVIADSRSAALVDRLANEIEAGRHYPPLPTTETPPVAALKGEK